MSSTVAPLNRTEALALARELNASLANVSFDDAGAVSAVEARHACGRPTCTRARARARARAALPPADAADAPRAGGRPLRNVQADAPVAAAPPRPGPPASGPRAEKARHGVPP